jgi:hypothetical protein
MPTLSTERTRKYRAKHKDEETYKEYNRETTKKFREQHSEEYKKKNAEHNKRYRERLKAKDNAVATIGNVNIASKARNDYIQLVAKPVEPEPIIPQVNAVQKSYYQRKKEALLNGTPMVLMKRGRKPKA